MKAFVTGSTGLLGSNLVYALRAAGHEVRALARSPEKARKLLGASGAEIVTGDMEDINGFAAALEGSDVLFHTAAYFREYYGPGDHWAQLERINVRGTLALLEQAERRGVQKTIYVSSSGAIGRAKDGGFSTETTGPDAHTYRNLYFKSKVVAEEAVAGFVRTHKMPVVLINPVGIFGPRDAAPTASGAFILQFLNGTLAGTPPGGFSIVDARDVANAMIAAVERGKNGERYIISEGYHSAGEIIGALAKITGLRPTARLPYPAVLAFAYVSEFQARLTGKAPQIPVEGVRTLARRIDYSSAKAVRDLGVSYRPMDVTMLDMVNWFIEHGYVEDRRAAQLRLQRQQHSA